MTDGSSTPIWVYVSHESGKASPVALELLGKGQGLAERAGARLEAVVMGTGLDSVLEQVRTAGATTILVVDDPALERFSAAAFAWALSELALADKPQAILLGA
ncbi:MAG: electron transfer flavoprotein subunit alpha, partial [Acidobacteria bacterium]